MKKEAILYEKLKSGIVHCYLCNHHCKIAESRFGTCGVRQNIEGVLYTLVYAEAMADHIDPIEKKPLYHFFPGSTSYSIATVGCNFRCSFCQNWQISQASKRDGLESGGYKLLPEDIVQNAINNGCKSISYTYTEPTIFFEYAYDTARLAKEKGIFNNFVTNGYMTKEALDKIRPFLDAANVDLKFFKEESYKNICNACLEPVLESIRYMKNIGIWVEVTTLVVPGLNDSLKELAEIAKFIASVGKEVPWHLSRFHPDYQYTDAEPTPVEILQKGKELGKEAGLRYVYLGNVAEGADTDCYKCGQRLISRGYLYMTKSSLKGNACPKCSTSLDGIF
jgi:pyruvate formate lyase activating enzyme